MNASLLDFGFIRWKSNNFNAKTNDASFSFTGIDLTEIVYAPDSVSGDSIDAAFRRLRDAAEDEFGYTEDKTKLNKTISVPRDAVLTVGSKSVIFVESSESTFSDHSIRTL